MQEITAVSWLQLIVVSVKIQGHWWCIVGSYLYYIAEKEVIETTAVSWPLVVSVVIQGHWWCIVSSYLYYIAEKEDRGYIVFGMFKAHMF